MSSLQRCRARGHPPHRAVWVPQDFCTGTVPRRCLEGRSGLRVRQGSCYDGSTFLVGSSGNSFTDGCPFNDPCCLKSNKEKMHLIPLKKDLAGLWGCSMLRARRDEEVFLCISAPPLLWPEVSAGLVFQGDPKLSFLVLPLILHIRVLWSVFIEESIKYLQLIIRRTRSIPRNPASSNCHGDVPMQSRIKGLWRWLIAEVCGPGGSLVF